MKMSPCSLLADLGPFGGYGLGCAVPGAGDAIAMLALVCVVLAAVAALAVFGTRRLAPGVLATFAAALLALAVGQPVLLPPDGARGGLLLAVLDASDSVTRDGRAAERARQLLAGRVEAFAAALPAEERQDWRAGVVAFRGDAAEVARNVRLADLPGILARAPETSTLPRGSDAAAGLAMALDTGGETARTALILAGDGNWPDAGIDAALSAARARASPIHVLPHGSAAPAAGLVAADLAPEQTFGADATVRMTVRGRGILSARINGTDGEGDLEFGAGPDALTPARISVRFPERGVQYLDLAFRSGPADQRRRLFTTVRGPARVLVFGPQVWRETLAAAGFEAVFATPGDPPEPTDFDAVIIDGMPPSAFPASYPGEMLAALDGGTGLFLINGPMRGTPETPTAIMSWEATELGPVLPVSADGRRVLSEAPPRDVVVIVDASASMRGWRLSAAKRLAYGLIDLLRPEDTARILVFADSVQELTPPAFMDADAANAAKRMVAGLSAGGGTDARRALAYADRIGGNYCGIFFLSDGDFATAPVRPGCTTTLFEIKESGSITNPGLATLGEVKLIRPGDENRMLKLKFFEPEPRTQVFRPGSFRPLAIDEDPALTPALDLPGLAISYPRADALRVAVHPTAPPDPVLAFAPARGGTASVGAFLSAVPDAWHRTPEGRRALGLYLRRLVRWSEPDRHLIEIAETGDAAPQGALSLSITVVEGPPPGAMTATVETARGQVPVFLTAGDGPGHFTGRLTLPAGGGRALLHIEEPGSRRQSVPMRLPPMPLPHGIPDGDEDRSFGIDRAALERIARITGGTMLDSAALPTPGAAPAPPGTPLHGPLIAVALLAFAATLWAGGSRT